MLDETLSAKLDAAWGNPASWVANGLQWTHLREISATINRRVSGDADLAPMGWFARHVARRQPLPLGRVLVVGCGTAQIERTLVEQGWASEVVAFDLSTKVLAEAQARAGRNAAIRYVRADMNRLPVGPAPFEAGSFDAVVGVSSIHHCAELERLYAAVARLLVPDGWFFLDEYVGPDRFQYSAAHMRHVSALADLLPDRLLTNASGAIRRGFRPPSVDEVVAVDPSEAVCSSRIIPLLFEFFAIDQQRGYGGALLHLLLAEVAQNFTDAGSRPYLRSLIAAEEDLYRLGALEHHFACVIARARHSSAPGTASRSTPFDGLLQQSKTS
jgi:SAM-dependent methyltransferase